MTNETIIHHFKKAMAVLQVIDNMPFRWRAYQNAIDTVQNLDEELSTLTQRTDIAELPGIGKEITAKIHDLLKTGESDDLNQLYAKVPPGMFPLLDIPGIGAKKAFRLANHFNLTDSSIAINELKKYAEAGEIAKLEGFGAKSAQQILENLERQKPKSDRMRLDQADILTDQVITFLKKSKYIEAATALGSARRRKETVGDIDLGASTTDIRQVEKDLRQWNQVQNVSAAGNNLIRLTMINGKQVDIKFSPPHQWGSLLQHFTGSKAHNVALRELALKQGLSLSEHGIRPINKDKDVKPWQDPQLFEFDTEEGFYTHLKLSWIPPEMRENEGEIELAQKHQLPKLVELQDIKGDFHTHTNYSGWVSSHDQGDAVIHLFKYSEKLGYEWLAIGDHNPSQKSHSPDEMVTAITRRNHWIDTEITKHPTSLKILKTLEIDILSDGKLAIPNDAIDQLDFAIVSVHAAFNLSHDLQTKRILTALAHPKVKILGHPTGRLINQRASILANWDEIFDYCLAHRKVLEINASPRRLDLPDSLAKLAISKGVRLSLGSDAHQAETLTTMNYAIGTARRAWAKPSDIINTYSFNQLQQYFNQLS